MKVYILHGWTYSLDKWNAFCNQLHQAGFEAVQLKVPGLTVPSEKALNIKNYIEWLDKELAGEQNPVVIGHSNGGRIALAYTQQFPDRLGHLILIDSAGVVMPSYFKKMKKQALQITAKAGKPLGRVKPLRSLFYRAVGAHDYLEASPHMRVTMQNMFEADKKMNLAYVRVPTTIIWGKEDTYTPLAMGQKMHQFIKGSHFFVIEGAKHAPFHTHPHETVKIIQQELKA